MFKRILKWLKGEKENPIINNPEDKPSPRVKAICSFFGLKIELENPNGITMVFAILFLIVVLVIIFFLHKYIPQVYHMIFK
jgi:hypothetical protein